MIITIKDTEQAFTKNGAEYVIVHGVDGTGKDTTKSVFDNHKDKWPLLKPNATLEFKMVKKGQFWNVEDITTPNLPPPTQPQKITPQEPVKPVPQAVESKSEGIKTPDHAYTPAPQERGMWWKELGEGIRSGDIDKTTPRGKMLRAIFYDEMFRILSIKFEEEK